MSWNNFGNADTNAQGGSELIPDGTLAWAIVKVRPYGDTMCLTPSKSSDGAYLDVELTILEGKYARRKIWDKIGLQGSEKWVARGMSSVRHILEVGRQMTSYEANNPGYHLQGPDSDMVLMGLNELRCAIKVGIEKGQGGYQDKNTVKAYLSPNPASDTNKAFVKLCNGETEAEAKVTQQSSKPAWGGGAAATTQPSGSASPPPAASQGRPSWAGGAPKKDPPF